MSKHTKGPWVYKPSDFGTKFFIKSSGDKNICYTKHVANARLIAAAPDMLELLKSACSLWGFMRHDMSLSCDERDAATRKYNEAIAIINQIEGA